MAKPDEPDEIILSVALRSGKFRSELHVPFPATAEARERAVEQWLDLMQTGFRIGATSLDAVLSDEKDSSP